MANKELSLKEMAMRIKADANAIVQDFNYRVDHEYEIKLLFSLVNYMDKFILRCLDSDGNLINSIWISARLIEFIVIMSTSKIEGIRKIVNQVSILEKAINSTKGIQNGKNSSGN